MFQDITILRPGTVEDLPFIHNSWVESAWFQFKHLPEAKKAFSNRVSFILQHCGAIVCADKEDPRVIYGYVVHGLGATHWVYVKYPFRKNGLCNYLLEQVPGDNLLYHTHTSKAGQHIIKKVESVFTPFIYERI